MLDRHLTRVMAHKEVTVWSTSTTTTVHGKSLYTAKCKNVKANEKIELRDWDKDMTTGSLEHNSINDTFIYNELLVPKVGCWRGCTFLIFVIFFSVRLLSVLRDHPFFSIRATTANDLRLRRISIPDLIHYIIFLYYSLRKSQHFPFQCWVLNKGTTGTIL